MSRLIDDCCRQDPAERIAEMPTLIERIALARTIIAKKSADEGAPATIVDDPADDEDDWGEDDWGEDDNLAAIVEGLGLSDDDDEPIDIGDPETDVPPGRS